MEWIIFIFSAFYLGLLTAISPCPLATNIAAISFMSKGISSKSSVVFSGIYYTFGRVLAYVVIGFIFVNGLILSTDLSVEIQRQMNLFMGPLLILIGMVLLKLILLPNFGSNLGAKLQTRFKQKGLWGAMILGIFFALSFCPSAAVIFFGGLLPLALKAQSSIFIPAIYGIATGLPVLIFTIILAMSAHKIKLIYEKITVIESYMQKLTGLIFLILGIYLTLTLTLGIN